MRHTFAAFVAAAVLLTPVIGAAGDTAEKSGDSEKPVTTKEITLTGKLTKSDKKYVVYTLKTADGVEARIPNPKNKEGKEGADVIKLDDFVDKDVTITAQAVEKEINGKKLMSIKSVTKIVLAGSADDKPAGDKAPEVPK